MALEKRSAESEDDEDIEEAEEESDENESSNSSDEDANSDSGVNTRIRNLPNPAIVVTAPPPSPMLPRKFENSSKTKKKRGGSRIAS